MVMAQVHSVAHISIPTCFLCFANNLYMSPLTCIAGMQDCDEFTESPTPTDQSTKSTSTISAGVIAAIIVSFLVMIAMTGVMVLILFHYRKTKQLRFNNPSQ